MQLTVDQVTDITLAADLELSSFTNTYSGRGMYGERCIGWDVDDLSDAPMVLALAFAEFLDPYEARRLAENARTDNMGLGYIIYFPGSTCDGWVEDEEDDDDY